MLTTKILETYKEEIEMAEDLGWFIDKSRKSIIRHGPIFILKFPEGETWVWKCRDFWQCADLILGQFINHRPNDCLSDILVIETRKHNNRKLNRRENERFYR